MSAELVVINPLTGAELFRERSGMFTIDWESLVRLDPAALAEFQRQCKAYIETHPRLEVYFFDAKARDQLVIRWRWHS